MVLVVVGCPETLALRLCQQSQITQNKRTYQTDYQGYRRDPKCIDSLSDSYQYLVYLSTWCIEMSKYLYLYLYLTNKYLVLSK